MRPLLLALTLGVACTQPARQPVDSGLYGHDTGSADPQSDEPLRLTSVTWRVSWDETGLLPHDDAAWRIDRSDGASFVLNEGWLVLESVSLEPCEGPAGSLARTAPPHGWSDHPSADADTWALPLHAPVDQTLSTRTFGEDAFCEVGLGLFQAHEATHDLPAAPDLQGVSLHVSGQVRPAPDDDWTPVVWTSALSAEQDAPLLGDVGSHATVTVSLAPASLLDAVYLNDPPELAGRTALTNLARSISVDVQP